MPVCFGLFIEFKLYVINFSEFASLIQLSVLKLEEKYIYTYNYIITLEENKQDLSQLRRKLMRFKVRNKNIISKNKCLQCFNTCRLYNFIE